jgi:hypothetical protein|tara:strand:+ start:2415 stop:2537 length:123 start_codon:yes stop_codon:yes gene_type:complete
MVSILSKYRRIEANEDIATAINPIAAKNIIPVAYGPIHLI